MKYKKITIVCSGENDDDIAEAIYQATKHVVAGYFTGHNSNDTGAYYFDVTEDVPRKERPAR